MGDVAEGLDRRSYTIHKIKRTDVKLTVIGLVCRHRHERVSLESKSFGSIVKRLHGFVHPAPVCQFARRLEIDMD